MQGLGVTFFGADGCGKGGYRHSARATGGGSEIAEWRAPSAQDTVIMRGIAARARAQQHANGLGFS